MLVVEKIIRLSKGTDYSDIPENFFNFVNIQDLSGQNYSCERFPRLR